MGCRRRGTGLCVGLLGVWLLTVAGCEQSATPTGTTVITIWAHQGQAREHAAMQQIVADFNAAHADERLQVQITFFPDRAYAQKVQAASFTGELPDILDIDGPYVGPWAAEKTLTPIGELIPAEVRADLLPTLIEQGTYEGQLYAVGAFESALVVYYNRTIIAQAGLKPPDTVEAAWSWDEFIAALEAVKPYTKLPLALHMDDESDEWFTYAFAPLIWSAGGALIDTQANRTAGVLDGPQSVAALEDWQQLFARHLADPTTTARDPFSAGNCAFDWNGHWMLPTFEQTAGLDFGVMPLPRTGPRMVAPSGSWCWGMSSACKHPEAAGKVLRWLIDPKHGVQPIVAANGAVPGRRSAFPFFPAYNELPRKLFRAQLEQVARPRPRTAVYPKLTREFAQALRAIANGADVEKRLHEAATAVQDAIDRERQ